MGAKGGFVKAREWFERGNQEADPVDAFSNFWRSFNNLFFSETSQERDKIKAFLSQSISEAEAEKILQAHAHEIAYLLSQPVIDMRGNGRDTAANIQTFNATTDSRVRLQEVFMVIYQVRCNLEHGQKSPSAERDIQLCRSASPLVAHVVGHSA